MRENGTVCPFDICLLQSFLHHIIFKVWAYFTVIFASTLAMIRLNHTFLVGAQRGPFWVSEMDK